MVEGPKITFKSSDGCLFNVDRDILDNALWVKSNLDDGTLASDEEISLIEIHSTTFAKVVEYLTHVKAGNELLKIEKPLKSKDLRDVTTEWFANFIDLDLEELGDLINASSMLEIDPLTQLSCAKMGSLISGMTVEEFRKRFNLIYDFTPEEEAVVFDETTLVDLA